MLTRNRTVLALLLVAVFCAVSARAGDDVSRAEKRHPQLAEIQAHTLSAGEATEAAGRLPSAKLGTQNPPLPSIALLAGPALLVGGLLLVIAVAACCLTPRFRRAIQPKSEEQFAARTLDKGTPRDPEEAASGKPVPSASQTVAFCKSTYSELVKLHALFHETVASQDANGRQKMLLELSSRVRSLCSGARQLQLLAIGQMAASLEGLLRQMANTSASSTASASRTVAGALDVLQELCTVGLDFELAAQATRMLVVEDDAVSRFAVSSALKKLFPPPDVAADGVAGLALAQKQTYDVIFADVEMPAMGGFELCTRIHQTSANAATPVVFVTRHSDFESAVEAAMSGGYDLVGKPFLPAEVTLKALTVVLRSALKRREEELQMHEDPLDKFLASVPGRLGELRDFFAGISRAPDAAGREKILTELQRRVQAFSADATARQLLPAGQVAAALEGLLAQLLKQSSALTPSTLRTLAGALISLEHLCVPGIKPELATQPPPRFLAVDDDAVSRQTVSLSLRKTFGEPDLAASGEEALALIACQTYDMIFLDVEMPGMNGFELCAKIRQTDANSETPVVFVTSHKDFDSRAQASNAGGRDLIGKPFLGGEITLKALTLLINRRLELAKAQGASAASIRETPVQAPAGATQEQAACLSAA